MVVASKVGAQVGVILTGVVVTSGLLYFVYSELFGSDSPTAMFSNAVDQIRSHPEVKKRKRFSMVPRYEL